MRNLFLVLVPMMVNVIMVYQYSVKEGINVWVSNLIFVPLSKNFFIEVFLESYHNLKPVNFSNGYASLSPLEI